MGNILLTCASLALSILLIIIFFKKEKVENKETKIYSALLVLNLIFCITAIVIFAYAKLVDNLKVIAVLQKLYMSEMLFMIILIYVYNVYITDYEEHKKKKIANISLLSGTIISIIIFLTPLTSVHDGDLIDGDGISYTIMFTATIIYFVLISIYATKLFIKNKEEARKNAPFISLLILFITGMFFRKYLPEVWFENFFFPYALLIMYFTIENPDVKMLNKIELAKTQAEKANAAKTDFLSNMSHEIRTPLNAIVGFSEAIKEADSLEEAKENANDIIAASQNLLEIVNGILDISKIEANKMEIVNTEYNLRKECELLAKLIKTRIGEKPITLKVNIAPDIPERLYGDKSKVKEILSNILTNAVKYTKEGQIDFIVSCINKGNESSLVLSVEDTGRGIKPENIDKLFNKFERLDEDRNTTTEGAGLGLAITKKLVEMLNGKIIVQSVYGSGSKFTVYLKQRIIDNTNYMNKKIEAPKSELILSNKKILIVDDNEMNLKIATKLLEKYNPIIECCFSGYECLEKIKNGSKYDLILMDDMMPKMSGTETLHILNDDPNFKDKVVVLTANAIEGMKEKYIEDGFDDYLSKPIEKQELERVLRKFLNKEIEPVEFAPLPDEIFEISDDAIEKINDKN